MPMVVLKLFQEGLRIPSRFQFFNREVSIDEEIEFTSILNMTSYKDLLSSDMTILLGTALIKNPRL